MLRFPHTHIPYSNHKRNWDASKPCIDVSFRTFSARPKQLQTPVSVNGLQEGNCKTSSFQKCPQLVSQVWLRIEQFRNCSFQNCLKVNMGGGKEMGLRKMVLKTGNVVVLEKSGNVFKFGNLVFFAHWIQMKTVHCVVQSRIFQTFMNLISNVYRVLILIYTALWNIPWLSWIIIRNRLYDESLFLFINNLFINVEMRASYIKYFYLQIQESIYQSSTKHYYVITLEQSATFRKKDWSKAKTVN